MTCISSWLVDWWLLLAAAAALPFARVVALRTLLSQVGPPVPGVESLRALLVDGRYRGVPVRDESNGAGRGRFFVRPDGAVEIQLPIGMLERRDVDALAILEHERGHAAGDLPSPRWFRLAVLGTFLAGLAFALGQPALSGAGSGLMAAAYGLAALHVLRDEAAASAYARRHLWPALPTAPLRRVAIRRLALSYALYLIDWAAIGVVVLLLGVLLGCRATW